MHSNDYQEAWHRYRTLRKLLFFVWLGYMPVGYVVMTLVPGPLGTVNPIFVFAGIWMAMFVIVGIRLSAWRCPRCGKRFSGPWLHDKGFLARKCIHCGLPNYAADDSGPGPERP